MDVFGSMLRQNQRIKWLDFAAFSSESYGCVCKFYGYKIQKLAGLNKQKILYDAINQMVKPFFRVDELGYALATRELSNMLLIYNEDFVSFRNMKLPFDISNVNVVPYSLDRQDFTKLVEVFSKWQLH